MIINGNFIGDIFDLPSPLQSRISEEERKDAKRTMKRLAKEKLQDGDETELKEISEQLLYRGISENSMDYKANDRAESLTIIFGNDTFQINRFINKSKRPGDFHFKVKGTEITYDIPTSTTPESIADFVLAVQGYMPEYRLIKDWVTTEEEQKKIARKLAADLLKNNICRKLTHKGYDNKLNWSENRDDAQIRISISTGLTIELDVNLSEDFFEDVTIYVESLPEKPEFKECRMSDLHNILCCTVYRSYDEGLLQHIRHKGFYAIINNDELWVPNMSWSKLGIQTEHKVKVYRKKHVLPKNAPVEELKALDSKLEEHLAGYSEEERKDFLDRLVIGEIQVSLP